VTSTPLIDWASLVRVLLTSAATGIGIVVLFSIGVVSLSVLARRSSSLALRSVNAIVMAAALATIVATVVWGIYVIVHK
jgi:hypothetical protein